MLRQILYVLFYYRLEFIRRDYCLTLFLHHLGDFRAVGLITEYDQSVSGFQLCLAPGHDLDLSPFDGYDQAAVRYADFAYALSTDR